MNDKSHASLEQHVCLVCGARFDTGAILLDKRLRASMERHTATDWGLCPEHQKLSDDGFVALVECDPQRSSSPSGADRMKPRTGVPDGAFGAPETRGVHSRVQRADRGQAAVRVRRTRRDRAVAGDDCALIARPPSGALSFGTTRLFSAAPGADAFAPAALRASLALQGKAMRPSPPRYAWRPSIPPPRLCRRAPPHAPAAFHPGHPPPCCPSLIAWASPAKKHGRSRCRAAHRASLRESRPLRASIADAYGPASSFGPARFACVRFGTQGRPLPCPAVSPDFITLSATVARSRVPSRRAGPCPRLRLRAAPTLRLFP